MLRSVERRRTSGITDNVLNNRSRRNGRRARQIDDAAYVVEVVELALPIVTHDQDVGLVRQNILPLLLQALLDEHLVDGLDVGNDLKPFILAENRITTLLREVEIVGGHADNEPVTELGRAVEHPHMSDMEYVEGTERDDGLPGQLNCSLLDCSVPP